jgi:glutaminyl-peptide cyclotransferase
MKNGKTLFVTVLFSITVLILVLAGMAWWNPAQAPPLEAPEDFDGQAAYELVAIQLSFGPRIPNSEGHARIVEWIQDELDAHGWQLQVQETEMMDIPVINITGRRDSGEPGKLKPWVIIGAHYDTRIHADHDPDPKKRTHPVPGANDGGSGVAVLLELARVLPEDLPADVWLVFFDAEDNGGIDDLDWIMGSRAFAAELKGRPQAVIIVDMIGDADLNIYKERFSTGWLSESIWDTAAQLGYSQFIPEIKYSIIDDHIPFLEAGIPAVDIIDFDYPYWHTTHDTLDKVSAESLEAVGRTLHNWLMDIEQTPVWSAWQNR